MFSGVVEKDQRHEMANVEVKSYHLESSKRNFGIEVNLIGWNEKAVTNSERISLKVSV